MGDPKFSRPKYETPSHPWQAQRIKEERDLVKKYGLKNKTEVWKARSLLRSIRGQARDLQGKQRLDDPQVNRETRGLLSRLYRAGMLEENATLDDVLSLNVEAVLVRRLQTQAYLKGLAATPSQARQLIIHGHIAINGSRVTIPGMILPRADEGGIQYTANSPLTNEQHPVRPKFEAPPELRDAPAPEERRGGGGRGGGRGRGGPGGRGRGGGSKPRGGRRPAGEGQSQGGG
ncbi:MAG TPA: 30S ribosomal protein S4 [Candidatus Thermoplasmatota archaeon]|nr:30S ribosomal protein S4 [Candidatus Thermoplasmatota archaeon]